MIPEVVNMRRCDPVWGQPGDVRIDRTTIWGNPYPMYGEWQRTVVISAYENYLRSNASLLMQIHTLADAKRLGCWCKPKTCHGDIIVKVMKEMHLI